MDDEIIEGRFDLVGDQIEHLSQRVDALESLHAERADAKESRHSRLVNWLMLGLFVVEVGIGIYQLVWVAHHA
jgi:hypothetical protein